MRTRNIRFLLAILLPFVVCGLQWLLWDHIKPYVWFLFFPTAYLCAWIGGLWGGFVRTVISALLVWSVFIPPSFSFKLNNPATAFSITVFVIMGSIFAFFFEQLRRAQVCSETRFEATFEQAAVGIALVATNGRLLRVNHKICEIVGYSQNELLSRNVQDIAHIVDIENDLAQVRQLLDGSSRNYSIERRYSREDGSTIWIDLTVTLVRNSSGTPDYFIAVA